MCRRTYYVWSLSGNIEIDRKEQAKPFFGEIAIFAQRCHSKVVISPTPISYNSKFNRDLNEAGPCPVLSAKIHLANDTPKLGSGFLSD